MSLFFASYPLFVAILHFLQFAGYGIFVTADSVLLVLALGPKRSQPFINALHFFISIGFLVGTFLVRPFLPDGTRAAICAGPESGDDLNLDIICELQIFRIKREYYKCDPA